MYYSVAPYSNEFHYVVVTGASIVDVNLKIAGPVNGFNIFSCHSTRMPGRKEMSCISSLDLAIGPAWPMVLLYDTFIV